MRCRARTSGSAPPSRPHPGAILSSGFAAATAQGYLGSAPVDVVVRVLGPLEVLIDGVDVTPPAPKERALLGLLVIRHGRVVGADQLMEELWPTLAADRARRVLQVRVAALRKLLSTAGAASAAGTRRARLPARHRRRGRRRAPVPRAGRASAKPCRGRRPHSGVGHTPRRTRTLAGAAPGRCPDVCLPGGRGRSAGRRASGRDRGSDPCRPGVRPPPRGGVRARRARGHGCLAGEVVGTTGPSAVSLRPAVGGPAGVRGRPLPIVRGARRGAWARAPRPRGSRPGAASRARLVGATDGGAD